MYILNVCPSDEGALKEKFNSFKYIHQTINTHLLYT